ncbi:MAG TPA: 16S rRNA (guanine(527)-N(7))-methyltransferase RsmG [Rhodocyclaceae bacterium]|nr:16S rRNA (guanine(527)-N(7))-methyltransferase RsmG [Rhodocyclaceae bacterium]
MNPASDKLRMRAAAMGVALSVEAAERLLAYQALLIKWNRTYNLTAIRDPEEMLTHHLLDSLVVAPLLPHGVLRLADVGSGGGLPGIPLAIARPEIQVTLIETSTKKSAFQQQAKIELGLDNVSIYSGRVEDYEPKQSFDGVISRAFAELKDFVIWAGALAKPDGRLYAMKGLYPEAEVAALPPGWQVLSSQPLLVAGLDAQRHLLVIGRCGDAGQGG